MLRDHLKINASDTLEKISNIHLQNQGQEEISEFVVKNAAGLQIGKVSVHDRFSTRRSYPHQLPHHPDRHERPRGGGCHAGLSISVTSL